MAKVRVPQADGEITLSRVGEEPKTYRVTDHEVTVAAADLDNFLVHVDGAREVGAKPVSTSTTTKEK
jgi:hypothetical protein